MSEQSPAVGIMWAAFASDPTDTPTNLAYAARMAIKYGAKVFLTAENLTTILNNGRSIATNEGLIQDLYKIPAFADIPSLKAVRAKTEIPLSNLAPREFQQIDTMIAAYIAQGSIPFEPNYKIEMSSHGSDQTSTHQLSGIYPRVLLSKTNPGAYKLCGNLKAQDIDHIELEEVEKIQLECLEYMETEAVKALFRNEALLESILPPLSNNVIKKLGVELVGQLKDTHYRSMYDSWAFADKRHPYRALFDEEMLINIIMGRGKGHLIEAEAFLIQDEHWIKAFPGVREDVAKKVLANVSAEGFENGQPRLLEYIESDAWISFEMAIPNDRNYCRQMTLESHPYLAKTSNICKLLANIWPPPEKKVHRRRTTSEEQIELEKERKRLEELEKERERLEKQGILGKPTFAKDGPKDKEAPTASTTPTTSTTSTTPTTPTTPKIQYEPPRMPRNVPQNSSGYGKSSSATGNGQKPTASSQIGVPLSTTSTAAPLSISIAAGSSEEAPTVENTTEIATYFFPSFTFTKSDEQPFFSRLSAKFFEQVERSRRAGRILFKSIEFKLCVAGAAVVASTSVLAVSLYFVLFKRSTASE
jgi:hypothetical protein